MIVTVYTKGKKNPRRVVYRTVSETPMHKHLRQTAKGVTVRDPKEVITNLCIGWPLDEPIVIGGEPII